MRKEMRVSKLAVACVLCTAVTSAFGAASVRTLGGAGTYTSASSAAGTTATRSGPTTGLTTTAARAGSVRVTPTTSGATATTVSGNTSTTAGRAASNQRLSIGKYLGGSASISTGTGSSGSSSSGGMDASVASDLRRDVDQLMRETEKLHSVDDAISDTVSDLDTAVGNLGDRVDVIADDYLTTGDAAETYVTREEFENADFGKDVDLSGYVTREEFNGIGLGNIAPNVPIENGDYILTIKDGAKYWTAIEIVDK